MTQHDFPRTAPANRHEIAHTTADHEPCLTGLVTQEAIRIEDGPGIQAVSLLPGDQLAAMQMPGEDEVVAGTAGCLPDSRVVSAQDPDMPIEVRGCVRAGDRNHTCPVRHARDAIVNPLPAALRHRFTHAGDADLPVVVTTNRKDRCGFAELANQLT